MLQQLGDILQQERRSGEFVLPTQKKLDTARVLQVLEERSADKILCVQKAAKKALKSWHLLLGKKAPTTLVQGISPDKD